jgi:hypothetical protein
MPSLYQVMDIMKDLFTTGGYTIYDIQEFDSQKITRLDSSKFPVICLGRQIEEIDNEGSPLSFLSEKAGIDLNVILNTGRENLEQDGDVELRKIKNIVYKNRNTNDWCDWIMIDSYIAQLANTNDHSEVYGGININTTIKYRECEIYTGYIGNIDGGDSAPIFESTIDGGSASEIFDPELAIDGGLA